MHISPRAFISFIFIPPLGAIMGYLYPHYWWAFTAGTAIICLVSAGYLLWTSLLALVLTVSMLWHPDKSFVEVVDLYPILATASIVTMYWIWCITTLACFILPQATQEMMFHLLRFDPWTTRVITTTAASAEVGANIQPATIMSPPAVHQDAEAPTASTTGTSITGTSADMDLEAPRESDVGLRRTPAAQ